MFNFLKRYWFLGVLFLVALMLFLLKIFFDNLSQQGRTPLSSWRGVVPGKDKAEGLVNKLGAPRRQTFEDGKLALEYVRGEELESLVYIQNNTVDLVRDYSSRDKKLAVFKNEFGRPEGEFYGPHAAAGFKVFVFASDGTAAIAKPDTGTVIEVWYFEPTSLQNFLSRWGTNFTTERAESF